MILGTRRGVAVQKIIRATRPNGDFRKQKYKGSDAYFLEGDLLGFFEDYKERYDLEDWSGKHVWFISNDLENETTEQLRERFETAEHFTLSLVQSNGFKIEDSGDISLDGETISLFALLGLVKEEKPQVDIKILTQKEKEMLNQRLRKQRLIKKHCLQNSIC